MIDRKISRYTVVSTRIIYTGTRKDVLIRVQMFILYALFRTLSLRYVRTVQLSYTGTADSLSASVHVQTYGMSTYVQYSMVRYSTVRYVLYATVCIVLYSTE